MVTVGLTVGCRVLHNTGLDLIVRSNFLSYIREQSEARGVTTVYATHVFDGKN